MRLTFHVFDENISFTHSCGFLKLVSQDVHHLKKEELQQRLEPPTVGAACQTCPQRFSEMCCLQDSASLAALRPGSCTLRPL